MVEGGHWVWKLRKDEKGMARMLVEEEDEGKIRKGRKVEEEGENCWWSNSGSNHDNSNINSKNNENQQQ